MNTVGKGKDGINLLSWNVRAGYAIREAVVSPCPGDFTSSEAQVMFRATPDETGSGAGINWVLDEPNRVVHARCAKITTGRDWYLNIRNTQCFDEKDVCIHYLFAIPAANRT